MSCECLRWLKESLWLLCVFTTPDVSLNIPEGVLFTDVVKRLKVDGCFHE